MKKEELNLNINIKNYKGEENEIVGQTPLLKKSYKGGIDKITEKGMERSIYQLGYVRHIPLTEIYLLKKKCGEEERQSIYLNLMADQKGNILSNLELIHWTTENTAYRKGKKYSSTEQLNRLKEIGCLKLVTKAEYKKGVASEARVKGIKKLSDLAVEIVSFYLDRDVYDLYDDIYGSYMIRDEKIYHKDPIMQLSSKWGSEAAMSAQDSQRCEKYIKALNNVMQIKRWQKEKGITEEMIRILSGIICPGYQKYRREAIYEKLLKKYNIEKKDINKELIKNKVKEIKEKIKKKTKEESNKEINLLEEYKEEVERIRLEKEGYKLNIDEIVERGVLKEISKEIKGKELRERAIEVMRKNQSEVNDIYNEAISLKVLEYKAKDKLDERQKAIMLSNGTLPYEYKIMSERSPRVYGRGADNLFYTRKELRMKVMEGLGFKDIDLQNCHAEIMISIWGKEVPKLKECIDKGSLWEYYEEYYKEKGLKFYKKLIKSLHHATFLGGGKPAYKKALERYNQSSETKIENEEYEEIVKEFKNTEIYKELKELYKNLKKEWVNKVLICPTGEKFLVKETDWKVKKEKGIDTGNFGTVLSAYLQSIEVLIISYLIVRCEEIFIPILWQHDGLTIKCLYKNSEELIKETLNEFCDRYLNRRLKLTTIDI